MSRNTLIVVTSAGSLPLLRFVALKFVQLGRPCTMLYMGARDGRFEQLAVAIADREIELFAFEDEVAQAREGKWSARNPSIRAGYVMTLAAAFGVAASKSLMKAIGCELAAADQLLKRIKPDSIIVAENGISGPLAFLSRAKFLRIPIFTVPYGNARPYDIEIDMVRKRLAGERIEPKGREAYLFRLALRSWLKQGRESGATMFQPRYIIALEAMGITLRNPWIVQGGPMTALFAEGRGSIPQYLSEGIPKELIKLTGSPFCDEMVEALTGEPRAAAALLKPVFINHERPRVLISWPPDYHQTHCGKSEFESYQEMSSRYFEVLRSKVNLDVTVSLHPSAGEAGAIALRNNGILPATEHLVAQIARHDIFVSFYSSATRWPIAAGKPVINIDLYDQRLPNFLHLRGVVHTRTLMEFSQSLDDLTRSPDSFAHYAKPQVEAAADFGIMDGKCVERIVEEVDRACAMP